MIKEACVESLAEAIAAEELGADRIELCSRLDLDGLTPDFDLIRETLSTLTIPVKIMIRPRGGYFVYTQEELQLMEEGIDRCKTMGVTEVVFGVLDQQNQIDIGATTRLAKRAYPMKVTFHKAIDDSPDILFALKQMKTISEVTSILTSGGMSTALEGQTILKRMVQSAGGKLTIIPAGRITDQNINEVHKSIGATEYHGRRIVGELS